VFADVLVPVAVDGIESIKRSTAVAETNGRFAILGAAAYTDTQVEMRVVPSAGVSAIGEQSVLARWTDSSNYARLVVPSNGLNPVTVKLETVVAGVVTTLAQGTVDDAGSGLVTNTVYRYRIVVYATGRVFGWVLSDAGTALLTLEASSTDLATGGTLASGKPGIRDRALGAFSGDRYFTGFSVSTPAVEPIVVYSGRNMQVRYDDTFRQDSTGTYTGRPQSYRGSRFMVPVGTSRVLVKARRNDIDTLADANVTDATQIQVGWTPRGLAVPR
jgi:hypothetical protein